MFGGIVAIGVCALVALVYCLDKDSYYQAHQCCDRKLCQSGTGIPRCANRAQPRVF